MAPFSATDKAPGVYIEEIQTPGAIPGVGTSTAAFVGPAEKGPTEPTFLTSYKQFDERFGGPVNGVFAAHAVRGFFENGGTACYFVRVGNGKCASLTLKDRAGNDVLRVTAIQEGAQGNKIQVAVSDASIVPNREVVKTADPVTIQSSSGNQATLVNHADQFNIGDIVVLTKDQTSERATITWKDGLTLSFKEALANQYGDGTVRIADLEPGQRTFRLNDVSNIEPGTYLQISQEGASEVVVVEKIDRINQVVTLDVPGLHGGYGRAETTVPTVSSKEFQLVVTPPPGGGDPETFEACSLDQRHNKYVLKIKSKYVSITFTDPRPQTAPPNNLPAPLTATALTGGRMITSGTLQAPTIRPRSMN